MSDLSRRLDAALSTDPKRPVKFLVKKNGQPFALLNACPALAERTLADFRRAEPESGWTAERC